MIYISWCLTTVCNYKCSYCTDFNHNGNIRWPDYKKAIAFISDVQKANPEKYIYLECYGGEPTVWPELPAFISAIQTDKIGVEIISNGNRTFRWWQNNANIISSIYHLVLSYHTEFADDDEFAALVEYMCGKCKVHVNIMMNVDPELYTKANNMFDRLSALPIGMKKKPLRIDFGSEVYKEYTKEQLDEIEKGKISNPRPNTQISREIDKRMAEYTDLEMSDFLKMYVDGTNAWKGYNCNIGIDKFAIIGNDIYKGTCRVGDAIGTLDSYELPTQPVVCTKDRCSCFSDAIIKKWK